MNDPISAAKMLVTIYGHKNWTPTGLEAQALLVSRTLLALHEMSEKMAEDEGLWFITETAPEAYLQQELRRLCAAIEGVSPEECALRVLEQEGASEALPEPRSGDTSIIKDPPHG